MPFHCDVSPWLGFQVDEAWLAANVQWKDFGTGVKMGRLARDGSTGLVLYRASADVEGSAFTPHTHTGGEAYLVLSGEVYDDDGSYPAGTLVWMKPGSRHTPKTRGDTLILVLWPDGIKG